MRNEHEHMFFSLTVLRTSRTGKDGTKGEEQKTKEGASEYGGRKRRKKRRRTKRKKT